MGPDVTFEAALTKARARIIWGDTRQEVEAWLVGQGVPADLIARTLEEAHQSRAAEVRERATRGLWIGGIMAAVGGIPNVWMWRHHMVNFYVAVSFGTIFLLGVARMVRAGSLMASGASAHGSTTDMES